MNRIKFTPLRSILEFDSYLLANNKISSLAKAFRAILRSSHPLWWSLTCFAAFGALSDLKFRHIAILFQNISQENSTKLRIMFISIYPWLDVSNTQSNSNSYVGISSSVRVAMCCLISARLYLDIPHWLQVYVDKIMRKHKA